MSVRVVRTDHDRDYVPFENTHADAVRYDLASDPHVGGIVLHVFNAEHRRVATYAPGVWASAEILPEPDPAYAHGPELTEAVNEHMARLGQPPLLKPVAEPVNAAAFDDYPEAAKCPSVTLVPPAEAVPSETSEPYVSVSVSANANDADELAKLLRKIIRSKGAKSFGLVAS